MGESSSKTLKLRNLDVCYSWCTVAIKLLCSYYTFLLTSAENNFQECTNTSTLLSKPRLYFSVMLFTSNKKLGNLR